MSYTPTTWNTGDTITPSALNKIEQGIAEGGGGGYDLVIEADFPITNISSFSVTQGSILDCEQKVSNKEPVNCVLITHGELSYVPTGANSAKFENIYRLTYWSCPYRTLFLGQTALDGGTTVGVTIWTLQYDASTGALTGYSNAYNWIY